MQSIIKRLSDCGHKRGGSIAKIACITLVIQPEGHNHISQRGG